MSGAISSPAHDAESSSPEPGNESDELEVAPLGAANEPWVSFTVQDYFGVALSGGGIRSATFNLGLLQALAEKDVLRHVDYLSTVSGGGYIGAFWTAWRQHHPHGVFPGTSKEDIDQSATNHQDPRESARIRHLRQFSRFLMPRVGIAHSETWAGVVAILGGIIPSLTTALALLAVMLYLWFGASAALFAGSDYRSNWLAPLAFGAITLTLHGYMEWRWRVTNTGGEEKEGVGYGVLCCFTVIASALALAGLRWQWPTDGGQFEQLVKAWAPSAQIKWWDLPAKARCWHQQMTIFGAPAAWTASAIVLLVLRTFTVRWPGYAKCVRWSSVFDRTIARLLAPAVVSSGLGIAWVIAARVREFDGQVTLASSGVGLAALFVWFRNWLAKPVVRTQGSELVTKLLPWLRPLLPQILANAAFVCFLLLVAILIQTYGLSDNGKVTGIVASAGTLLITLCFLDPARVGMHDFYRSRIARCFLGAARPLTRAPRPVQLATTEQSNDDMTFASIARPVPIHLVCCAANNLSGDPLGSLYRGARSAVVSPVG
ncbi:MAG TPA: patatin-like phospholipase family protein, partial [Polyangiaceae bacterium]